MTSLDEQCETCAAYSLDILKSITTITDDYTAWLKDSRKNHACDHPKDRLALLKSFL